MNPEEFRALVDRIVENRENQGLVTELATQLTDHYTTLHTDHSSLNTTLEEKAKEVDDLKKHNMNLYLKVGNPVNSEKLNNHNTGEENKLTYDDLLKNDFGIEV